MFAMPPAVPPPSIPDPVILEDVRQYAIEGRTEAELVAQMNAKGYLEERGRFWGYTSPELRWSFDVRPVDGRCELVDPKVLLIITTTLPSWSPPAGVSAAMVAKWRVLERALRHHEGEHAQIARTEARQLVALMRRRGDGHSCNDLDASLQREGRAIMRKADAANTELDERTHHGATEGVALRW